MNHRFARLMLVCFVVTVSLPVGMSAESRRHIPGNVEIIVNGVAQPRFEHNGRLYVEALKGRSTPSVSAIRIRSGWPWRSQSMG